MKTGNKTKRNIGLASLQGHLGGLALLLAAGQVSAQAPFRVNTALDLPEWLSVSGSERIRYSGLKNQFRPNLDENDEALSFRTLIEAKIKANQFEVVGEFQDARAYLTDENSGVSTIVVNAAEILQAYVSYTNQSVVQTGDALTVYAGRQTFDLGSRRLVARNRHRDTIQAFNGIRGYWKSAQNTEVTLFYVLPVTPRPGDLASLIDNQIQNDKEDFDLQFWGAFVKQKALIPDVDGEFYVFGLHEDDDPGDTQTRDRQLYTLGHRLVKTSQPGTWDFDVENVLQFGRRSLTSSPADTEKLDVFAHFHHGEIGYTFTGEWRPRLSAELDYATGNRTGNEGNYNRFDSLFGPRRAEFGPTGIYGILGRENIMSYGLRYGVAPSEKTDIFVSWRANYLAESTDVFARSGVSDPTGASGNFAGHQIELRFRYWLVPDSVRFELGGAYFKQGEFLNNAPSASGNGDPAFVYTDLAFQF